MSSIFDWSTTPASNANSDSGINWAEGQFPSTVNNSARAIMARLAELVKDEGGANVAAGTANALTLTAYSAFTTNANGRYLAFRAALDNTAAATLNVNGIGAKSIRKMTSAGDSPLAGAEIQADGIYLVNYSEALNGAAGGWLLVNPTPADLTVFATLASPVFTGNPTAPTPIAGDNDTSIATTAFVTGGIATAIAALSSVYQAASAVLTALAGIGTAVAGDIIYATGAGTWGRLAKGAAGQTLRMNSGATAPEWAGANGAPDAVMEDQKTSGTAGGTFTSGAWRARDLNTEVRDTSSLVTIASNQFTPTVAGWVEWSSPANRCDAHQSRLFNVTDTAVVGTGTSEVNIGANPLNTHSRGGAPVVAGKAYRVEHQCASTRNTDGFGNPASLGTEVYTRILFWRT